MVQQTIFVKRQMEILVIDSCSEQKEGEIVKEFQDRYDGIGIFAQIKGKISTNHGIGLL